MEGVEGAGEGELWGVLSGLFVWIVGILLEIWLLVLLSGLSEKCGKIVQDSFGFLWCFWFWHCGIVAL